MSSSSSVQLSGLKGVHHEEKGVSDSEEEIRHMNAEELFLLCGTPTREMRRHYRKHTGLLYYAFLFSGFRVLSIRDMRSIKSTISVLFSWIMLPVMVAGVTYRTARNLYSYESVLLTISEMILSAVFVMAFFSGLYMTSIKKMVHTVVYAHYHFGKFLTNSNDSEEQAKERLQKYTRMYKLYMRNVSLTYFLCYIIVLGITWVFFNAPRLLLVINNDWDFDHYGSDLDQWVQERYLGPRWFGILYMIFDFLYISMCLASIIQGVLIFTLIGGEVSLLIKSENKRLEEFIDTQEKRTAEALIEDDYGYGDEEDEDDLQDPYASNSRSNEEMAAGLAGDQRPNTSSSQTNLVPLSGDRKGSSGSAVPALTSRDSSRSIGDSTDHDRSRARSLIHTNSKKNLRKDTVDGSKTKLKRATTSSANLLGRTTSTSMDDHADTSVIDCFDIDWHKRLDGMRFNRMLYKMARPRWLVVIVFQFSCAVLVIAINTVVLVRTNGENPDVLDFLIPISLLWVFSFLVAIFARDARLQRDLKGVFGVKESTPQTSRRSLMNAPIPLAGVPDTQSAQGDNASREGASMRIMSRISTFRMEQTPVKDLNDEEFEYVEHRIKYRGSSRITLPQIWKRYKYVFFSAILSAIVLCVVPVYDSIGGGGSNSIIMGDFNSDCNYVRASDWSKIRLRTESRFNWVIGDNADTTTSKTDCAYDRFVLTEKVNDAYVAGSAQVFRFDTYYDLGPDFTNKVSDHYPIEMALSA